MEGTEMDFMGIRPDGAVIDLSKLVCEPGSGGLASELDFANEINKLLPWMAANQHKEWTLLIDFLLQEAAALITEAREAMADGK